MEKKIILPVFAILSIALILVGTTYAYWKFTYISDKTNIGKSKCLSIELTNQKNEISLNNTYPISDLEAKKLTPYSFTINNTCDTFISYDVNLEMLEGTTMNSKYMAVMINNEHKELLSNLDNANTVMSSSVESRKLVSGSLGVGDSVDYTLRLWIDESVTLSDDAQNKTFTSKIVVNAQPSNYSPKDAGYDTLHDAILANEYQTTPEKAIEKINAKGEPDFNQTATTNEGIYTIEDNDGTSYYYRGNVKNNNVYFAGFYWKIIRINGDGSIRMMYSGLKKDATGTDTSIGYLQYSDKSFDPGYVGYMVNENFKLYNNNKEIIYNWFYDINYGYGTSYTFDETTKKFILSGEIKQLNWKNNHDEIVNNNYYSCLMSGCNAVYKITGYYNDATMIVKPITYSSINYEETLKNTKNSSVKDAIDSWYSNNLLNYSSYLADEIFCNDRTLFEGDGYTPDGITKYAVYNRLYYHKNPTLKCSRSSDAFSMNNESANLTYPVGLITADEMALAGGVATAANNKYYLYNATEMWTMTPSAFNGNVAVGIIMLNDGSIITYCGVTDHASVRPVISLKSDVKISSGIGTINEPFVIDTNN